MGLKKTFFNYWNQLFRDITSLGSFPIYALICLLILTLQEYLLFLKLVLGFIFSGIVVVLARMIYFKNRPARQNHTNFIERMDASSFPSWHTARVFILALLFIEFFSWNRLISPALLFVAIITAYSRVYLKKHDWSDLFGGLVLAAITFYLTTLF